MRNEKGLSGLQKIQKAIKLQYDNPDTTSINIASMSLLKNPRFLVGQIENNQRISSVVLQSFIEEGIKDGSIQSNNAKLLSEFTILLTNFWLIPSIYPCTIQELLDKVVFIKELLDHLGFPVFDEEIMKNFTSMVDQLGLE